MADINWLLDSQDNGSAPQASGLAQLGLTVTPAHSEPQQEAAASAQPMSRRELRERANPVKSRRRTPAMNLRMPAVKRPQLPKRAVRAVAAPPRGATPRGFKRRILSKLMTLGAMIGAGLMMVSTSLPANAFLTPEASTTAAPATQAAEVQSLKIQTTIAAPELTRDAYTASSLAEKVRLQYGNRSFSFTNNPNGTIQWPFAVSVPISSGFGGRMAPCGGCSSYHEGVDFTPGSGAPIQSIADGIVSKVEASSWGLGHAVYVDHTINGQHVTSVYGHMLYGSIRVATGQQVSVGDVLGAVGSTGASTGAHLHLEIRVNGLAVDPYAWLKANAN